VLLKFIIIIIKFLIFLAIDENYCFQSDGKTSDSSQFNFVYKIYFGVGLMKVNSAFGEYFFT